MKTNEVDQKKEKAHEVAELDFRTKNVTLSNEYPKLKSFPNPIQKLIVQQYNVAYTKMLEADAIEPLETPVRTCSFYRKYLLPCRHIWYTELSEEDTFLTDEVWDTFIGDWKECGYEIYIKKEAITIPADTGNDVALERCKTKEEIEQITQYYYRYQGIR